MASTLSERVKERMSALEMSNAELARLSGVEPPTSYNWASGKTKSIKAEPLLKAAAALKVTPEWLATGRPPKFPPGDETGTKFSSTANVAKEERAVYTVDEDPGATAAQIVRTLPPAVASEALAYLRWLAARHTPPVM